MKKKKLNLKKRVLLDRAGQKAWLALRVRTAIRHSRPYKDKGRLAQRKSPALTQR